MKRIDTLTKSAKAALARTIDAARRYGNSLFVCNEIDFSLKCSLCPFHSAGVDGTAPCAYNPRTAEEWIAWGEEDQE